MAYGDALLVPGIGPQYEGRNAVASAPLFLDTISTQPNAAYSLLRKLRTAYSGAAFHVRRASDNLGLDIGFVGNVVDTAAMLAHCAGTSGHVQVWYDQTTNGRNLSNITGGTGVHPRVCNAGVLETNGGGRLAASFRGSDVLSRSDALGLTGNTALTVASTIQVGAGHDAYAWGIGPTSAANSIGFDAYSGGTPTRGLYFGIAGAGVRDFAWANATNSTYVVLGKPSGGGTGVLTCEHETLSPAIFVTTGSGTALNISNTAFAMGVFNGPGLVGKLNAFMVWNSELAGTDRTAMHAEMALHK